MTPTQFKAIRLSKGFTQSQMAKVLRLSDKGTIYRYEDGQRKISGPISLLMELIDNNELPAWVTSHLTL